MDNIEIFSMSGLEYYLGFIGYHSALSNQYAGESEAFKSLIGAKLNGNYAGYACVVPDGPGIRIAYAFTVPEDRNKGVFTELVRFVSEHTDCMVRINITSGHEFYNAVLSVCRNLGFIQGERAQVYLCRREQYPAWQQFMQTKGKRLCDVLKRRGYEAVSFQDAGEDLLRQLRESPGTAYRNTFQPGQYLDHPEMMLSMSLSFAAIRNHVLAAYTLVTQNSSDKYIFEQISDSAQEQGTGVILLPFAAAMDAFYETDGQMVSYAMYEDNLHAHAFRRKLLNGLHSSMVISENYYRKRSQGQSPAADRDGGIQ